LKRSSSGADDDLRTARHGFSIPEVPAFRVIAFHAQQGAEKYLKAYLVFHLVDFPRTQDIGRLLEICAMQTPWASQLSQARELSPYAVTMRYPGEDLEVGETEARRAVEIAEQVRQAISSALHEEGFEFGQEHSPS
jgi:HEPN domain-containing protein